MGRLPADARFLEAFGEAVRAERERKDLSQEELGFEAGLDRTYVSGIERGVRNPTVVTIRRTPGLSAWQRAS